MRLNKWHSSAPTSSAWPWALAPPAVPRAGGVLPKTLTSSSRSNEPEVPSSWRDLFFLASYLRPYRTVLGLAFLLVLGISGAGVSAPLLIRHAIDQDIPNHDLWGLAVTVAGYFLLQLLIVGATYVEMLTLTRVGQSVLCTIKAALFRHVLTLPLSFFEHMPGGKLVSRIDSDGEKLGNLLSTALLKLVSDVLLLLGIVTVMIAIDPRLFAIAALLLPLLLALTRLVQLRLIPLLRRHRESFAVAVATMSELAQNRALVKALDVEPWAIERTARLSERELDVHRRVELGNILFHNSIILFEALGLSAALWFGGTLALGGAISLGTVILFMTYIRRIFEPIQSLSTNLTILQEAMVAAGRIRELHGRTAETSPSDRTDPSVPAWRTLAFEKVSFRYSPTSPWVLQDLSFSLARGERLALVGDTGSGKTTIVNLALRFWEPEAGRLSLDGHDLGAFPLRSYRALFGLVLQEVLVFPGSFLDNARLFDPGISEASVREVCHRLDLHTFLDRLPNGLHTQLSERGDNLSQGERQILALVRAVLRRADLLILDEATASIDRRTEAVLQRALYSLGRDFTTLIIAHRLETITDVDRILVLERGTVVEEGDFSTLSSRPGPFRRYLDTLPRSSG